MGTIFSRRRKDESLGYTVQIRTHRQGKCIHSESETFDRRQLATEWMRRREAELDQQRARGEPLGKGSTFAELLEWFGSGIKELKPWERTKEADLKRLANFTRATRLRGLRDLRFHDLCHEPTSHLFERGYDIPEAAQFTLHESWTTLKRYTHLQPEQVEGRPAKTSARRTNYHINTNIIMPRQASRVLGRLPGSPPGASRCCEAGCRLPAGPRAERAAVR